MEKELQQLHTEMLADIQRCRSLHLSEEEKAECCYRMALNYWCLLKKYCQSNSVIEAIGEVEFFKHVKPRFTCYIEFFTFLYEAVISLPSESAKQKLFWEEELKRYDRFRNKNYEFVKYYEDGKHACDSVYFKRVHQRFVFNQVLMTYDNDKNFCSSHDHLIRSLLAHKLYYQEVRQRLTLLEIENKF